MIFCLKGIVSKCFLAEDKFMRGCIDSMDLHVVHVIHLLKTKKEYKNLKKQEMQDRFI